MATVGITGATGFVGARLVDRCLAEGYQVRVLSRSADIARRMLRGVQVYEGDLTVPGQELGRFVDGVDVLYHCAGELQ